MRVAIFYGSVTVALRKRKETAVEMTEIKKSKWFCDTDG